MRTRAILISIITLVFVSCVMPSPSFACTQPPIQPSSMLNLETWPANILVGIVVNNVPNGPVTTAYVNWNEALATPVAVCSPTLVMGGGNPGQISMSFQFHTGTVALPNWLDLLYEGSNGFRELHEWQPFRSDHANQLVYHIHCRHDRNNRA